MKQPTRNYASDGARRQHEYEVRLREAGWKRLTIWVAEDVDAEKVREYARKKWGVRR